MIVAIHINSTQTLTLDMPELPHKGDQIYVTHEGKLGLAEIVNRRWSEDGQNLDCHIMWVRRPGMR